MTDLASGFIGAFVVVFCIATFAAGMAAGSNLKVAHCDDFGRFKHNDVLYECKRSEVTK